MKFRVIGLVLVVFIVAGCGTSQAPKFSELPAGDATNGAALFAQGVNGAPSCSSCHNLDDTTLVGPGMAGYGARAATRVEGESAAEYTFNSIVQPSAFVVSGFGNTMYTQFGRQLSAQQIADLIAYLLTL
jgi:mono/diheme cytochrome c family protein